MSKEVSRVSLKNQRGKELGTFDWEPGKGPILSEDETCLTIIGNDRIDHEFLSAARHRHFDDTAPDDQRLAVG